MKFSYLYMRKRNRRQYVKMIIVGNYVFCISNNGTIYKLVIVRIGSYQSKMKTSIYT